MKISLLVLALSGAIEAQELDLTSHCPADAASSDAQVASTPSISPLIKAATAARVRTVDAVVVVLHSADGSLIEARIEQSSGNQRLDNAIVKWASQIKTQPGKCGYTRAPVKFYVTL